MTLFIIIFTSIISVIGFSNRDFFYKYQLNPYLVKHRKQYYRVVSHAFLHAGWVHLIINMLVLYSFGIALESYFKQMQYSDLLHFPYHFYYLFMYFSSIIVASLTTLKKYKDIHEYNAVGASGAVSAVLFACIFFNPWQKLYFWAIIPIPGIIFGILYLWYSSYMSKRGDDNVNHDAHFLGALYGISFPIILEPKLFYVFIRNLIDFQW